VGGGSYPIFVAGDFYVAMQPLTAGGPALGVDTSGARSDRGWVISTEGTSGWFGYSQYAQQHGLPDGNLMIRAVLSPVYNPSGMGSVAASQFAAASQELAFIMISASVAAAAVGLLLLAKHVTHRER